MYIVFRGSLDNPKSVGTNTLIKEFAQIVTCPEDIINNYKYLQKVNIKSINEIEEVSEEFKSIYKLIGEEPVDINYIARESKIKMQELSFKLTMMELEGKIKKVAGNSYIRDNKL